MVELMEWGTPFGQPAFHHDRCDTIDWRRAVTACNYQQMPEGRVLSSKMDWEEVVTMSVECGRRRREGELEFWTREKGCGTLFGSWWTGMKCLIAVRDFFARST